MKQERKHWKVETTGQFVFPWAAQSVTKRGEFVVSLAELNRINGFWDPIRKRRAALRVILAQH